MKIKNFFAKLCNYVILSLVTVDNIDTVSNGFVWFHTKNETKRNHADRLEKLEVVS